ncbi:TPA: succinate dehydrogenase assembly factor 2, partial [Haemophilus influenzae]
DIFIRLLASTDLQLFSWFFNRGKSSDSEIQSMVEYIQNVQKITTN